MRAVPQIEPSLRTAERQEALQIVESGSMTRYIKPAIPVDLTCSGPSVVSRSELCVLWAKCASQLTGLNDTSLHRFRNTPKRVLASRNCPAIMCQSRAARESMLRGWRTLVHPA